MTHQPTLTCLDETRRQKARDKGLNGIDYVEITDDLDQRELCVHLFHAPSGPLHVANVRIEGGERVRDVQVMQVWTDPDSGEDDFVRVRVNKPGDFSLYTLRLVEVKDGKPTDKPLHGFDPRYAKIQFSFKVGCPSDLDCKAEEPCPPLERDEPEINYLAKDYASFRQLILDRLALIMPDWQERHVPDIGIALVEIFAYVGDQLSYYQDAVANEAYLDTARQRISVRRHTQLVDYQMHEGCNARAWLALWTSQDHSIKLSDLYFTTEGGDNPAQIFEPLTNHPDASLRAYIAHNTIHFHTWGGQQCCLPRAATSATLVDGKPIKEAESASAAPQPKRELHLKKGDVLIFKETKGPKTGNRADADPLRRHAVRLTKVEQHMDSLYGQAVLEIEWADEDALPFPLCLSVRRPAPDCDLICDISVAHGNVILVDHGQTIDPLEDLGQVGRKTIVGECVCEGSLVEMTDVPKAFRPRPLKHRPLTFSERLPAKSAMPVSRLLYQNPRRALPQIVSLVGLPGIYREPDDPYKAEPLKGVDATDAKWRWYPQQNLLGSQSRDRHFVAEVDNDGLAHLRFGDGELGQMPETGTIFRARYRVGNGPAGNVGADTITVAAWRNQSVSGLTLKPRNPMPAQGGTAPEPIPEAKLFAPGAFSKEVQRAVTADDYALLAQRNSRLQRAGASLRWTGSWYAAQVAVDPLGTEVADDALLKEIEGYLYRYRRIGHDLEVRLAEYVPVQIELQVCVLPHYLRGHVEAALLDLFSSGTRSNGQPGFFHPDKLTFGDGIYLSKLVAAAQAVPGVESVRVTKLQRFGEDAHGEIAAGVLPVGPLEIAQLDNDPNFPEHGTLKLNMGGGR